MTVNAMHAFLYVNVLHMHGFFPKLLVFGRHNFSFLVEKITLTILLENAAEHPTMTMVIRKLRMPKLWIQLT